MLNGFRSDNFLSTLSAISYWVVRKSFICCHVGNFLRDESDCSHRSNNFSGNAVVYMFTGIGSQLSVGMFCVDKTDKRVETVD